MCYAIDSAKIHNEIGWLPTTFDEGIKKTIKWYLDNKAWWENIQTIIKNFTLIDKVQINMGDWSLYKITKERGHAIKPNACPLFHKNYRWL